MFLPRLVPRLLPTLLRCNFFLFITIHWFSWRYKGEYYFYGYCKRESHANKSNDISLILIDTQFTSKCCNCCCREILRCVYDDNIDSWCHNVLPTQLSPNAESINISRKTDVQWQSLSLRAWKVILSTITLLIQLLCFLIETLKLEMSKLKEKGKNLKKRKDTQTKTNRKKTLHGVFFRIESIIFVCCLYLCM